MTDLSTKLVMAIAMCIWTMKLHATNYYFSTASGNDSRTFTQAQNPATPWRTIAKLNTIFDQLQPGDKIYFKRGEIYYGSMQLNHSGSSGNPILISAYGTGDRPVISGFEAVGQWTSVGGGIYESNVLATGSEVNMVVINGTNYAKGRYPNANEANGGYLQINSVGSNSITCQALGSSPDWDGATAVIRTSHWTLERKGISSHSGNSINYSGSTVYGPEQNFGFFIQDDLATLDQYGEWYYDPSTKKISIYFGGTPGATIVQVSTHDFLADITGDYLTLEELKFEGSNLSALANNSQTINHLTVRNCDFDFSGSDAIFFHLSYDFTLEGCQILNSNNCGVKLFYSPNATIRNNVIQNSGIVAGMGQDGDGNYSALHSEAAGLIAEDNQIINTGYIGLRFGQGDNLIRNNYINTFCTILDDGAGIYAYDSDGIKANRQVVDNIVINGIGYHFGTSSDDKPAEGIYLDDNCRNVLVKDNTVANCSNNGIFLHNTQHIDIQGNTFYNNGRQGEFKSDHLGNSLSNLTVNDNLYIAREMPQAVFSVKSDAADIGSMGEFDQNYYVRPLYNAMPIFTEFPNGGGNIGDFVEIPTWQANYGHGTNSEKSPIDIPYYQIDDLTSSNKLTNEGFDNNVVGTWCYAPTGDCQTDWIQSTVLDDGCLEVSGPSPSRVGMSCGAISNSKYYIVRFSALASQTASLTVYLMQNDHPWAEISSKVPVQLDGNRREYEVLIPQPTTESSASIQLQFGNANTVYWVDNIQMYEASISMTDPDDYFLFDYNTSTTTKTISLDGEYFDGKGNLYTDQVTIQPFRSIVLIKNLCNASSFCPSGNCTVSGDPIASDTYFATYTINSAGRVANGGQVDFHVGESVQLNGGFSVDNGGALNIEIVNCSQ